MPQADCKLDHGRGRTTVAGGCTKMPGMPLLLLMLTWLAPIPSLSATPSECAPQVELTVSEQPVSQLLQTLAEQHEFSLSWQGDQDPLFRGQLRGSLTTVINQLTRELNVIRNTRPQAGCPQARLHKLIVLPSGEAVPRIEAVPEGLQRYRRAHGMDPISGQPLPRSTP